MYRVQRYMAAVMLSLVTVVLWGGTNVSFTAQAPQAVEVSSHFRISYKVTNDSDNIKEFRAPDMGNLEVLSGPSTSTSKRTSIINGKQTNEVAITYTFIVMAPAEGEYTLPSATVKVDNNTYTSNTLTIKALPSDDASLQSQGSGTGSGSGTNTSNSKGGGELFMTATVNKTQVYEQEAVLLSYKVYADPSVNLTSLTQNLPDFKGIHAQAVELPSQKEFQLEHYNGKNYKSILWMQYVLFPQQTGEIVIPSVSFDGVVTVQVESDDLFDSFFNMGRYYEEKKTLVTKPITLNVKALPFDKTSTFYGGVGDFSISSTISSTEMNANEAVTVKVVLSGSGNLKLIKTPELKFPADFDVYDPQVENKFTLKNGTQTGNKVFEYLAIPRFGGEYTIPAVEFTFFDTKRGEYKTIQTQTYTINVAKGEGSGNTAIDRASYVSKEDLRFVGEDVRFSATDPKVTDVRNILFGSSKFYAIIMAVLTATLAIIVLNRRHAEESANVVKTRRKRAGSTAGRRLKKSQKLMGENKKDEFFDETLRALWGYVSDKLSIPVGQLSKENIQEKLMARGVDPQTIELFNRLLDDCEFARYAPGESGQVMERIYKEASLTINQLDSSIK